MHNPNLKVLVLTHSVVRKGGAYYRGLSLGRGLAARGHQVTVMGISERNRWAFQEEADGDVRVVHSPDLLWGIGRTGWDPWDTLRRVLWLRRHRFDIVYTVDTRPAVVLPALYARRRHECTFVSDWTDWWGRGGASSERSDWFSRIVMAPVELFFEEAFRPRADGTVTISRALYRRAQGLGIAESRMLHLPTGCDHRNVRPVPPARARAQLNLDPDGLYVGYLGNIYQRDADLMIEAMRRLDTGRDARLIMIGDARVQVDADFEASGRLLRTGRVPAADMVAYLSACDVLLLPLADSVANRGRWPSKINDYLAVGRPVVAAAVGDLADLFERHEIGRKAPPEPWAFARAVDELLADPEAAKCMGGNARRLAEDIHSEAAMAERLERFLWRTIAVREYS